jgi:hypothetical protein
MKRGKRRDEAVRVTWVNRNRRHTLNLGGQVDDNDDDGDDDDGFTQTDS